MLAPKPAVVRPLPASIELLSKQIPTSDQLRNLLPAGTRVYLADIGTPGTDTDMLVAARHVQDVGCIPVPHFAARRIRTRQSLETRIGQLAEQAGVADVLVVAGGAPTPAGPYSSAMDLLETGFLDRFGIKDLAVAGHPEGGPDFTDGPAFDILRQKMAFADRTAARLRIVTQFGFNPARALAWTEGLAKTGIDVPVHIGVAGPASLAAVIRYATLCGVNNAPSMLSRSAGNITSLTTGYSPETFVIAIEEALAAVAQPAISQIHIFPFNALENASSWLCRRGSWQFSLRCGLRRPDREGQAQPT